MASKALTWNRKLLTLPQTPPHGTWPFITSPTSDLPVLLLTHSVHAHWSPWGPQTHRYTPTSGPLRSCSLCLEHVSPKCPRVSLPYSLEIFTHRSEATPATCLKATPLLSLVLTLAFSQGSISCVFFSLLACKLREGRNLCLFPSSLSSSLQHTGGAR